MVLFSDQPAVAARLAKLARFHGAKEASLFDASAHSQVAALTAAERDGRFMIHSADWGSGPRWASLADLFVLSTSRRVVACAGPYSPSTFCEVAAALQGVRRALDRGPEANAGRPLLFEPDPAGGALRSTLLWCPAAAPGRSVGSAPQCCEALVLRDDEPLLVVHS